MSKKIILCRCEDVTLADVERAVASGWSDLEEVKRYTGFGTGPCQGKECLRGVAMAIAEAGGGAPAAIRPFTTRPPLVPTELKHFAAAAGTEGTAAGAEKPNDATEGGITRTGTRTSTGIGMAPAGGMPEAADIAIIGAGVMGLALAYNLAAAGAKRIVVIDAHYLAWGASGRNGGGVRQQWSTEMNIRLMQESLALCAGFAQEMGINVWMRQGGYLFLARTEATRARLEATIALQNRCDVPTRMVDMREVRALVPELETDGPRGAGTTDRGADVGTNRGDGGGIDGGAGGFAGACFNPTDAIVFPWPFLWGYARAAQKRGVAIHTATEVTAIERRASGDFLLRTSRGPLVATRVVNAAGAWSPAIARLAGVELPDWPERHEILSTEPLKPFLSPMVSVLESGLYFSQSLRGEIVGGITVAGPRDSEVRLGSRLRFVQRMAAAMVEIMPRLGDVKVVRQWAGPYDLSPDGDPIVGEAPGLPGFYLCCGFVGHGFMMAPVVSRYYARHLLGQETHALFGAWSAARFSSAGGPGGRGSSGGHKEVMNIG